MAVAAFWIALAAVLIAGSWRKKVTEQMRHETVRLLIEKGGADDQQVNDLLNPPHQPLPENHPWNRRPEPGIGRKVFRVLGAIVTLGSIGVGVIAGGVMYIQEGVEQAWVLGATVGGGLFVVGLGLFFASNFLDGPSKTE